MGIPPQPKPAAAPPVSPAYRRLEEEGDRLLQLIAAAGAVPNKDLAKFTDQLHALIEKWDR